MDVSKFDRLLLLEQEAQQAYVVFRHGETEEDRTQGKQTHLSKSEEINEIIRSFTPEELDSYHQFRRDRG
ncbi:hypothetical protein CDG81_09650 [Actinopolyspora erythraea]|uniref:Uncharacterized protein n=1 Tax=Actinopolyspora erythraea TaxID=414996 RepID=A0A223RRK5_9ACTN|nr:hypothetical protein CDG81_09650 [Actinopolyspora erythraea]